MNEALSMMLFTLAEFNQVWLIGLLLALFVFMILVGRGQKRDKAAQEEMLKTLGRNDKIITRGGIIGVITDVKDDEIVIKVDENTNTKMRIKRWGVAGLLSKDSKEPSQDKDVKDSTDARELAASEDAPAKEPKPSSAEGKK